jgi:hypothetical protein
MVPAISITILPQRRLTVRVIQHILAAAAGIK